MSRRSDRFDFYEVVAALAFTAGIIIVFLVCTGSFLD